MVRVLDLYCGAGGAARGYADAGMQVVMGVDIAPQKRYPYTFIQADVIKWLYSADLSGIDLIHASPPCQRYCKTSALWEREHPDLVGITRRLLDGTGLPYVIENVVGAPLVDPIMLCGTGFGLNVIRHRLFEISGFSVKQPPVCNHAKPVVDMGRWPDPATEYHCVVGHFCNVAYARQAMGIDWMVRDELSQAIPPAYTSWIANQFLRYVKV